MAQQEHELLVGLSHARKLETATRIVEKLESSFQYTWRPVGDSEANYGLINIGSDPGRALIERVTNAVDAIVERYSLREQMRSFWESGEHSDITAHLDRNDF